MSVPPGPNPPFFQGGQPAPQHGYQQPGAPYPAGGQYPSGGPYPPYANPGGVNTQPQPRPGGKKLLIAGVIVLAVGLVGGVIMAIMGIGGLCSLADRRLRIGAPMPGRASRREGRHSGALRAGETA